MARPPLEVADLVRCAGRRFIGNNRHWLNRLHLKVLTAIERCRTADPGGHVDKCTTCGHQAVFERIQPHRTALTSADSPSKLRHMCRMAPCTDTHERWPADGSRPLTQD